MHHFEFILKQLSLKKYNLPFKASLIFNWPTQALTMRVQISQYIVYKFSSLKVKIKSPKLPVHDMVSVISMGINFSGDLIWLCKNIEKIYLTEHMISKSLKNWTRCLMNIDQ